MNFKVEKDNIRLDKYLVDKVNLSRSKIQSLVRSKKILVNGDVVSNNYKVCSGDRVEVLETVEDPLLNLKPSNIEIDVVYENNDFLVINKKSGMVVHPAPGNYEDTLVNALIGRYELSNNSYRPGIVHRLDKDTSGLMLVAKNDFAHERLSKMIEERVVERFYIALVEGVFPNDTGTIDAPIGRDPKYREKMTVTSLNSKKAITHFKVLKRFKDYTLIECKLDTGRTHQIRVHMKYINHPIVNDPLYGKTIENYKEFGQLLHSYKIKFPDPRTGEMLEFTKDVPEEFENILKNIVEID